MKTLFIIPPRGSIMTDQQRDNLEAHFRRKVAEGVCIIPDGFQIIEATLPGLDAVRVAREADLPKMAGTDRNVHEAASASSGAGPFVPGVSGQFSAADAASDWLKHHQDAEAVGYRRGKADAETEAKRRWVDDQERQEREARDETRQAEQDTGGFSGSMLDVGGLDDEDVQRLARLAAVLRVASETGYKPSICLELEDVA